MSGRKGSSSKDAPKTQLHPNPPFLPLPSPLSLHPDPNLQNKKRKGKEIEEGEFTPPKDPKQQNTIKGRQKETSVESKEDSLGVEVHRPQCTWAPFLELDDIPIAWDASVWSFQGGHLGYIVEALEQSLLLPRDMDTLRHFK